MRRFLFSTIVLPAIVIAITYAIFERDLRAARLVVDPATGDGMGLVNVTLPDVAALTAAPPPVQGPPPSRLPPLRDTRAMAQAMIAEWEAWMADTGVARGTIAIVRPNGDVVSSGIGRAADHPMAVGPISTTMTGLCLEQILPAHGLTWDTSLGDLAELLTALGVPPAPWSHGITLSDLVTYSSTPLGRFEHFGGHDPYPTNAPQHLEIAARALSADASGVDDGDGYTNHTHFAILGAVIEALAGTPYASACQTHLLDPANVTSATTSGQMAPFSSVAGWEMSAPDAARMAHLWFQDEQPWVARPSAYPRNGRAAMGYEITDQGAASIIRVQGQWCPLTSNRPHASSLLLADGRGLTIVALWDGCTGPSAMYHLRFGLQNILR